MEPPPRLPAQQAAWLAYTVATSLKAAHLQMAARIMGARSAAARLPNKLHSFRSTRAIVHRKKKKKKKKKKRVQHIKTKKKKYKQTKKKNG
eukprot:NODE_9996_length_1384_cov_5.587908.p2 GENE.NODE_9996_length_1384_cov_5.587908~~NODE_9996_length_1384_cov_5.587908.p2  ORF type:complete len:91 (+),score=41.36 NODE_9996_length_1384_cov_5.587908:1019-1291(+)